MSGATATIGRGAPPFQGALDFFRDKLSVPTPAWDTLYRDQHAVAFTVAGAMHAALLGDLRRSVQAAIAQGRTLAQFRAEFDEIVARHGWAHKGKPGWRARVIYETNLRTAYAAGKWQQIQQTKQAFPYLRYTAVMDNRTRPLHQRWHGTILPVDDEWWRTHYPPNGWGCRCTVMPLNDRLMRREGWKLTDPAPSGKGLPRVVRGSAGNRIEVIPPGIDPGWDYNVGMANARWQAARQANEQLDRLPPDIAAVVYQAMLRPAAAMAAQREAAAAEFRDWAEALLASQRADGTRRVVGALLPEVLDALRERGIEPANGGLSLSARQLLHMMREEKERDGATITREMALTLPTWIGQPERVLLEGGRTLLLVFPHPDLAAGEVAKVVVELRFGTSVREDDTGRRVRTVVDSIRTITRIRPQALDDRGQYQILLDRRVR
jgi:SPP1 gp7 family putative phage head morphogenesis protein